MRKKNMIAAVPVLLAVCFTVSSCAFEESKLGIKIEHIDETGLPSEDVSQNEPGPEVFEKKLTDEEHRMLELEYKHDSEGLSEQEYDELACIYGKLSFIKSERDILEEAYRLFGKSDAFEKLQDIAVNVEEEDENVVLLLSKVFFCMKSMPESDEEILAVKSSFGESTEEASFSDALDIIGSDEWNSVLMPKLHEGKRMYFYGTQEQILFTAEIGYNFAGRLESNVCALSEDMNGNTVASRISSDGKVTDIYRETIEGKFNISEIGSGMKYFSQCVIDMTKGSVLTQTGTIYNSAMCGEFTATVSSFDSYGKTSVSEIFKERNTYASETYRGAFDESGHSLADKPSSKTEKNLLKSSGSEAVVVYAYNDDKTKCLFLGTGKEEAASGMTFSSEMFGIPKGREVEPYEVADKGGLSTEMIEAETETSTGGNEFLSVRIYDGQVQVFDGKQWISAGSVESLNEKDPFEQYRDKKPQISGDNPFGSKPVSIVADASSGSNVGTVIEEKPATQASSGSSGKTGTSGKTGSLGKTETSSGNASQSSANTAAQQPQQPQQPEPRPQEPASQPQVTPTPSQPSVPENNEPSQPVNPPSEPPADDPGTGDSGQTGQNDNPGNPQPPEEDPGSGSGSGTGGSDEGSGDGEDVDWSDLDR